MNGTTMGEYLGWTLALRICTMGWMMERQGDADAGREFADSPHGRAMLAAMRELALMLWPNRTDETQYFRILNHLRGTEPGAASAVPARDVGLLVIRPTHSLLGNPPYELVTALTLAQVADRIWNYLAAEKAPDTVLTHHLSGGGRQATDGLRVPGPGTPWTIRECIADVWRGLVGQADDAAADVAVRLQAADAAACLLLVGRARRGDAIVPHTPSPETVGLATDRLVRVAAGPWLDRLHRYAATDGRPLGDVLALRAEARPEGSDADSRWRSELCAAAQLWNARGLPVGLRIGSLEDGKPALSVGLGIP